MSLNSLTASELSRKTGIAQPVIYRLVTGGTENPQILTLKPIADFFKVSIEQLLGLISLNNETILDNELRKEINNKLSTIKTIASASIDILPELVRGYQKAVSSNLIKETIPLNILPLLPINNASILKAANSIENLLITKIDPDEEKFF
jgi:transcriptional regulator with XRE-family HTH domain